MIAPRKRIVLYSPLQADPAGGVPYSKDVLPLSLLTVAGGPVADGWEVVLIDGEIHDQAEAHRLAVEACEGALLFATTGIIGYQVADGYLCAGAVRARHPDLPMVIGGWFASTAPHLQLETGLYDAVALGQGEVTFQDVVAAIDAGEPLDSVPGLALWRDGEVVRTEPRGAVGWDRIAPVPWHLLDFERYAELQLAQRGKHQWEEIARPPMDRPFTAISYYSSFGCPLQCTFCCSPEVSGLRWKAMPAQRMVEDIVALRERWGFDVVRWMDANYGVMEKRVREVAEGLAAQDRPLYQTGYMQAPSVVRFSERTLEAMAASGFYDVLLGGETGDMETMALVKKTTKEGENLAAVRRLTAHGIGTQITYIIGLPGESEASMLATLDEVRRIQVECPTATPQAWPYRPIPGTPLFQQALDQGFRPPRDLVEWGSFGDYRRHESWKGRLPAHVSVRRRLFHHFAGLSKGVVRGRVGWWERRARRRLERDDWRLGRVEAKVFDVVSRLERAVRPDRRNVAQELRPPERRQSVTS